MTARSDSQPRHSESQPRNSESQHRNSESQHRNSESHPRHRLSDLLNSPVRFSLIATLAGADSAEFSFVRDSIEVSDSVLSKQVSTLESAGYVRVKKGYVGKRPRTWLSLTAVGRAAFDKHLEALRDIAG